MRRGSGKQATNGQTPSPHRTSMPVVSRLRFFARYNVHISKAGNLKGIGLDEGRIARFHIADDRLSPVVDVDMLDSDVLVTPVPVAGGGPRLALNRLATVGPPRTDTRASLPPPPRNLASSEIAAVCRPFGPLVLLQFRSTVWQRRLARAPSRLTPNATEDRRFRRRSPRPA
jgi:hypothetical protein